MYLIPSTAATHLTLVLETSTFVFVHLPESKYIFTLCIFSLL